MKKKNKRTQQFEPLPAITDEEKGLEKYERFKEYLKTIFANEGGLSNNKFDKGGITKYGISIRFLRAEGIDIDEDGDIDADDILWLNEEQAEQLYYQFFYLRAKVDQIDSQKVAVQLFDMSVNHGVASAVRMLQKVLRNIGYKIVVDGIIGSQTLGIVNQADAELVNKNLVDMRLDFYNQIVNSNPSQRFNLAGWRRRANSFR